MPSYFEVVTYRTKDYDAQENCLDLHQIFTVMLHKCSRMEMGWKLLPVEPVWPQSPVYRADLPPTYSDSQKLDNYTIIGS